MENRFVPHSLKQEQALTFETPIGVLACGIQFGKTTIGAVWMKIKCHKYTDPSDNFLIVSPTYKILMQSTLPPFLKIMEGCGTFNKAEMTFRIDGGGTVYFRSGTDADSIVGITNIRAIYGDEAGLYSAYFFENIQARAAFRRAQILLTTSPYALNWLYKDIIRPITKDRKSRPDVTLIQAASWENPYFPKDVIERNRKTMDMRRFNALFGGAWERMTGLVYDCFDEDENQCDPFVLPTGTRLVGGIDWGHEHPFVFKIRAITPSGQHFGIAEFYKSGLTISQIVESVERMCKVHDVDVIYCAPERPENIMELNRAKLPAVPANNAVRLGIDRHYELLKTRRLKYFRGMNPYTLDELESYHYKTMDDVGPNKDLKDRDPVKQNDDALDADRYISVMTFESTHKRKPIVPEVKSIASYDNDNVKRVEMLKRKPRHSRYENWS